MAATAADPGTAPVNEPETAPQSGSQLFASNDCGGCHEQAAIPGMIVRPLGGLSKRFSVDSLSAWLLAPPEPMPTFPLSEDERRRIAGYLLDQYP